MPYHQSDDVCRDGFMSDYGRFYAMPGRVEREDGASLRAMFLPKLNARLGYDGEAFIRGQLKHYDITYDDHECTGCGTRLMQKVLRAGACDVVPPSLLALEKAMHEEWLGKKADEDIADKPAWVLQKYFLTDGRPDHTKAPKPVGIPLERGSQYRAGNLRNAVSGVSGLHHATAMGADQTIFIGWDAAEVKGAAAKHETEEASRLEAEEQTRLDNRTARHTAYLRTLHTANGPRRTSIEGTYIVDCDEIASQWPDQGDEYVLSIGSTNEPGIYEASFDFGVLVGAMFISANLAALEEHCSAADLETNGWDEEGEEEEEEDYGSQGYDSLAGQPSGNKRKASSLQEGTHAVKKPKTAAEQITEFHLMLKCRETSEGQIYYQPEKGKMTFKDANLAAFDGVADLPCVGSAVPFTARKVSDTAGRAASWEEFSRRNYDRANVDRWR
jgi:hypothetical protein